MTDMATIELSTDLLWNSTDPERYAKLVRRADPQRRYESTDELRDHIFGHYQYFEDGETKEGTRLGWHLNRNMYDPEPGKREQSVKLGGINLFVKTADEEYYLSEEGEELRDAYLSGEEERWKAKLAELVLKYSIRIRCMMYYLGVHGCEIHSSMGRLRGDEFLQKDDLQYRYYATDESDNGAYSAEYYTRKLSEYGLIDQESDLYRLYDLEYSMLATGLNLDTDVQSEITRLKRETKQIVDELAEIEERTDEETLLEIPDRIVTVVDDLEMSVEEIVERSEDLCRPDDRFEYVPNVMVDANLEEIIGPFCMDRVTKILDDTPDTLRLRGFTSEEPGGSKIIEVARNGLRLLADLNVLVEEDTGTLRHNTAHAKELFNEALVDDLFAVEHVVDDGRAFLDTFESACIEKANTDGVVFWPDIVDSVIEELGISRDEFDREIESQVARGNITFVPDDLGQPYHESPPGREASFVRVEFQ